MEQVLNNSTILLTEVVCNQILGTLFFGGSVLIFLYFTPSCVIVDVLAPSVKEAENDLSAQAKTNSKQEEKEYKELKESSSLSSQNKECSLEQTKESSIINETVENLDSYGSEVVSESVQLIERNPLELYVENLIALYDITYQAVSMLKFSEDDPLYLKDPQNFEAYLDCLFPLFLLLWSGDFMFLTAADFLPSDPQEGILEGIEWLNIHFVDIWELTECLLRGIYVHLKNTARFSNNLRLIERFFEKVEANGNTIEGFRSDSGRNYFQKYSDLFKKMELSEQAKVFIQKNWTRLFGQKKALPASFLLVSAASSFLHKELSDFSFVFREYILLFEKFLNIN